MEGARVEWFGVDAVWFGCLGVHDAWALTTSPAPQSGKTPLQLAVDQGNARMPLKLAVVQGKEAVAKMLREAGARE